MVLMDLSLESNYGPVCKKAHALYSNSAKGLAGRYYVLSEADEHVLLDAATRNLLEVHPKGALGAYVDFTDTGLLETLRQPLPPQLASILGETHDTFLKTASRDVDAVCELVKTFETNLIKARALNASDFTFHNVVSILPQADARSTHRRGAPHSPAKTQDPPEAD